MYHFPHSYALFPINLRIPVNIPTYPLSRTHVSPPSLTGRRPIAYTYSIPHIHENLQRITRTYLPIARTPPSTYTHLLLLLYVDARPLIRTSSPTCTYLFDKSFKRFIQIIKRGYTNPLNNSYEYFKGFIERIHTSTREGTYKQLMMYVSTGEEVSMRDR